VSTIESPTPWPEVDPEVDSFVEGKAPGMSGTGVNEPDCDLLFKAEVVCVAQSFAGVPSRFVSMTGGLGEEGMMVVIDRGVEETSGIYLTPPLEREESSLCSTARM
jgi:hypothetical protein